VTETPVLAVVDGLHGFGQTVTPQACADRHRQVQGDGPVHGRAEECRPHRPRRRLGEMAAEAGLVSVHSSTPRAACWWRRSAARARLSTAPFCAGIPRPGEAPVVLDFATSVVAEGKVLVASQGGKKLPDNA
jgi:uncharacterized oxidoreductase